MRFIEDQDIDNLKQILNSCWDVISKELINDAIDQWFNFKRLLADLRTVDHKLNIVSVNSVMHLMKLYFSLGLH